MRVALSTFLLPRSEEKERNGYVCCTVRPCATIHENDVMSVKKWYAIYTLRGSILTEIVQINLRCLPLSNGSHLTRWRKDVRLPLASTFLKNIYRCLFVQQTSKCGIKRTKFQQKKSRNHGIHARQSKIGRRWRTAKKVTPIVHFDNSRNIVANLPCN